MNYYSHHIGDYRRDTGHLSLLEHGVYRQLLDMYYLSETKIPEETESVYRRLCARTEEEKKAVDAMLFEFFINSKGWIHKRCDLVIAEYQGKAGRARENGKLGGRPSKTNVVNSGYPKETKEKANQEPITNNHEPVTSNQEPVETKPKSKPANATRLPYDFEQAYLAYPKRPGANKASSLKAWQARIKSGVTPETILDGVLRYAAYCKASRTDPGYIKQPSTFFGPNEHYLNDWTPPPESATSTTRTNIHEEREATIAALTGRRPNHEHEYPNIIDITPSSNPYGMGGKIV